MKKKLMKSLKNTAKKLITITITKGRKSYVVVNEKNKQSVVDFFENSDTGQKRLIQYLCDNLLNVEVK